MDVNAKTPDGKTAAKAAFCAALDQNNARVAELLIKQGEIDVNADNLLYQAVNEKKAPIVKVLLDAGANPDAVVGKSRSINAKTGVEGPEVPVTVLDQAKMTLSKNDKEIIDMLKSKSEKYLDSKRSKMETSFNQEMNVKVRKAISHGEIKDPEKVFKDHKLGEHMDMSEKNLQALKDEAKNLSSLKQAFGGVMYNSNAVNSGVKRVTSTGVSSTKKDEYVAAKKAELAKKKQSKGNIQM